MLRLSFAGEKILLGDQWMALQMRQVLMLCRGAMMAQIDRWTIS